jgi:GH15 family glucan-1,4-alpha-glucosidase
MMNYRDMKTGLPLPSYDLWEERRGILTFTASSVYGGLMAASNFAKEFGETELGEEYAGAAAKMRQAMDKFLFLKEENRFARMINFRKDGSIEVDATIDASLSGIFVFGAYDAHDPKVESTMEQIYKKLWNPNTGGLSRYESDSYYRISDTGPANPWFVTTLWLAQYHIARAKNEKDLEKALESMEWVADHALPSGVLAEQVNPETNEPISVSPLTWSHGAYIATVQLYFNKLLELEKCTACGLPKYAKYR